MNANKSGERPECLRDGRICQRLETTEVNRLNQALVETGVTSRKLSDVFVVLNVVLEECYLVLLHHVNRPSTAAPRANELVKLSERETAPNRASELWLRTPAYYRATESPDTIPTDPYDGVLTMDAAPWMRQSVALKVGSVESLNATMTFSAPQEPWIYCTSISPTSEAEEKELRAEFPMYDSMTAIRCAESFAAQLGIDFVFAVQKSTHVELGPIEEWAYRGSSYRASPWGGKHHIDKVVRVYHGPVVYEDQSGVLKSAEDVADPSMAPKGWFTKKKRFSGEREYRFAVSTVGRPRKDTFKLRVSDELRVLTAKG